MSISHQGSLTWTGCGKTAMVLLRAPGLEETAAQEKALVEDFTGGGGLELLLEPLSLSTEAGYRDGVLDEEALSQLLGEPGAPGECSGLYELAGRDEVGTVVLPPVRPEATGLLEDFALQHPMLLLCCQVVGGSGQQAGGEPGACLRRPLPNLAVLEAKVPGKPSAACLAGCLEARDFFPLRTPSALQRSSLAIRSGIGGEGDLLPFPDELRALVTWRRRQGLRRSLETGTRWTVFEYASEVLLRKLEREVRAFLHSLAVDGFLPFRKGFELKVSLVGDPEDGAEGFERRLSIAVRTRMDTCDGVEVEQLLPAGSAVLEESVS